MAIGVRSYCKRDGTHVRYHLRGGNPDIDNNLDVLEIAKKIIEISDKVKDMENFILGSNEDRYDLAFNEALSMIIPQTQAIIIAKKVVERYNKRVF